MAYTHFVPRKKSPQLSVIIALYVNQSAHHHIKKVDLHNLLTISKQETVK